MVIIPSQQGTPTPPTQKDSSGRVRLSKPNSCPSKSCSPLARLLRWWRYSALKLLVAEGRSFPRRMRWIFEIHEVEMGRGKALTHAWLTQGAAERSVYTAAYIQHMQRMETLHPFLSTFDLHLLSHSWTAGLEYGIRMSKLQSQDIQTPSTSTGKDIQ